MSERHDSVAVADESAPEPQFAHQKSKAERAFIWRLDIFLLTFGCISQIIKYLDQSNISNAYVSGMKEDLNLYGNELNYFTTWFNVAYCIMLIPSQVIMSYVRPSWWLPSVEIVWGVITGLIALTSNATQVYILRVFLGLCESAAYPGMITLFMAWYTPLEMAKRIGFYHSCQSIGGMFSGALQAAIVSTVNEKQGGLAGWRWLFIVNAIITVVWGIAGYFMIPDFPHKPNPWAFWFNKTHGEIAVARLERTNRTDAKKMTWAGAKRAALSWMTYTIGVLYIAMVLGISGSNYFGLFLKWVKNEDGSRRWSTADVNAIPIGASAISVAFVWVWAYLSDYFQTRWTLIVVQASIALIVGIMMSVWTAHPDSTSLGTAYAGQFIINMSLGTAPLIWSWLSDLLPNDPERRNLIVGASIAGYYAISAWSQVLLWPAKQAPLYKYGWQSAIALLALVIILTVMLHIIDVRVLRPKRIAAAHIAEVEAAEAEDDAPAKPAPVPNHE